MQVSFDGATWSEPVLVESLDSRSFWAASLADLLIDPATGQGLFAWVDPMDANQGDGMAQLKVRRYP